MGDLHPFRPAPVFRSARTLFLTNCDKNFVYYWLRRDVFPAVRDVYLDSHPCEYDVLCRFDPALSRPASVSKQSRDVSEFGMLFEQARRLAAGESQAKDAEKEPDWTLHLASTWSHYGHRWASANPNVREIAPTDLYAYLRSLSNEALVVDPQPEAKRDSPTLA